jgi:hypothetical protein
MPNRNQNLRLSYGLTVEGYEWLLKAQGNKCACCGSKNPKHRHGRFVVDHCHETGKVRGLLCSTCNLGIAKLGDSSKGILRAVRYLDSENEGLIQKLKTKGFDFDKPEPLVFKAERWSKKLNWIKVREIRKLATNNSQASIARKFGISQTMVSAVIMNKAWVENREGSFFYKTPRKEVILK